MSTAEYENQMSEIHQLGNPVADAQFRKLHEAAKKIHTDDLSRIEQFKSIMDKLMSIESDITLIKKHFNIVEIIGK